MYELNTLAHRYYLEDLERAARHDIAAAKHRQRKGPFLPRLDGLMRLIGAALAPFAGARSKQPR